MSFTNDLEWLNDKLDHKKVSEYVGCASDYNTVSGLSLDLELCPETGNSDMVVSKLLF